MSTSSSAIRGSRVGSGPMGETDHGHRAGRIMISYWDALGNETVRYFSADVPHEEIPEVINSPQSGLPAGRDPHNTPEAERLIPYKTHLAYAKERRTPKEAEQLLDEAVAKLRARRGK